MAVDMHDLSPYNYANNDPTLYNDPMGDKVCAECDEERQRWFYANSKLQIDFNSWQNDMQNELTRLSNFGGGGTEGISEVWVWCATCGQEISREQWIALGGDLSKQAAHYYPGICLRKWPTR